LQVPSFFYGVAQPSIPLAQRTIRYFRSEVKLVAGAVASGYQLSGVHQDFCFRRDRPSTALRRIETFMAQSTNVANGSRVRIPTAPGMTGDGTAADDEKQAGMDASVMALSVSSPL
jgi:hypothetical protein